MLPMSSLSDPTPDTLRARLATLPPDTLRAILEQAVAPAHDDAPAPDGSRIIRIPGEHGRLLSFRLSADDLRL
jgi:hypothetical protein